MYKGKKRLTEYSDIEDDAGKEFILEKYKNNELIVVVPLKLMWKANPEWSGE